MIMKKEFYALKTNGEIINALRKLNNLTQAELGGTLNVTSQAVSKWERDESEPAGEGGAMKKTWILLVVVVLSLFVSLIHSVAAQENSPIVITNQLEVSAVKNNNADESKDYTVTVKGTIKNNSTETISDVKIYLDVSTAFLGLKRYLSNNY